MKRNLSNQLAPETTARGLAKVLGVPVNCALDYLVAAFGHRLFHERPSCLASIENIFTVKPWIVPTVSIFYGNFYCLNDTHNKAYWKIEAPRRNTREGQGALWLSKARHDNRANIEYQHHLSHQYVLDALELGASAKVKNKG